MPRPLVTIVLVIAIVSGLSTICSHHVGAQPIYEIFEVSMPGQATSNVEGISSDGQFAIGTSNADAVGWTPSGGTVSLPGIPGRDFQLPQSVNDSGIGAGFGATTFFGSSPLPGTWDVVNGTSAMIPLVPGASIGRIFAINNSGDMVGSDGSDRAARYSAGGSSLISEAFPDGGVLTSAFGINNAGRVVGSGTDPGNAAVTRGYYLDPGDTEATDIGSLTGLGHNSAIAFDVAGNFIAGSSSFNSGVDGRAFIWEDGEGMSEIPLLGGTSTGSARGVNANGWAVGSMASTDSIPFVYDGSQTYRLQDLLLNPTGWDLLTGTSNAALGIADNGTIVGRGLLNGEITGFVAVQVPEPGSASLLGVVVIAFGLRRRR